MLFASPVSVKGRIESHESLEIELEGGRRVMSNTRVYVNQRVIEAGWIVEGVFADASPVGVEGAKEIRSTSVIPSTGDIYEEYRCQI